MTLEEILIIMENRLINLTETRKSAVSSGLLDQVVALDADLLTTTGTIKQLKIQIQNSINDSVN